MLRLVVDSMSKDVWKSSLDWLKALHSDHVFDVDVCSPCPNRRGLQGYMERGAVHELFHESDETAAYRKKLADKVPAFVIGCQ